MATNDDLNSAADLCSNAADAALDKLIGLGPRPSQVAAAALWDAQDAMLKNKISTLNNLSSSISSMIVVTALQEVWPNLEGLSNATASVQGKIKAIAEISKAMASIASVISFGVAVITVATQPTIASSGNLLTTFNNMIATL